MRKAHECALCGQEFASLLQFDNHQHLRTDGKVVCLAPGETAHEGQLRERRRTSRVTIGGDVVNLCEPECRNEVLLDLGIPGSGGWGYRARGEADVHVAWCDRNFHVTWERKRQNTWHCHLCGNLWMDRIPPQVAAARAASERMKGSLPPGLKPFSSTSSGPDAAA